MGKIIFLSAFALFCAATVFGQTASEKVQKMAQLFVSAYEAKDYARIDSQFNREMKAAVPNEKFKEFLDNLKSNFGKIIKLDSPNFVAPSVANFPVEFERGKMVLFIALDAQGKIGGLSITTPPPVKPKNTSRNQTRLALPFRGEWLIVWGGDTVEQNQHRNAPNQRFAFDILKVNEKGSTHAGDGWKNEDFYAFGQEIIAPADGTVIYAVDGVHDNKPGESNRMFLPGNTIIVKHRENEYSLFAHFKQNSIRVKVGDKVTKNQVLGLCGNSGNSSEPHLHFQVQNTAFFEDEGSMKTFFERITVKSGDKIESKTDYSPVKGDIVTQN